MSDLPALATTMADAFTESTLSSVAPLGDGNINDTFLVRTVEEPFVLQRLNSTVFLNPQEVAQNYFRVAGRFHSNSGLRFATPLRTTGGAAFALDRDGGFWRALEYLPHRNYSQLTGEEQACSLGRVLGRFHTLLATVPVKELMEPIVDFHNLPKYLEAYDRARKVAPNRLDSACAESVERYRAFSDRLEQARSNGVLQVQGVHGDPKCDNFIFDEKGRASGLLDLDTVGPGLRLSDIGDCLRSCCNTGGEEGRQPPGVDTAVFRGILGGYFLGVQMEEEEAALVYDSFLLISFELGLRFLTDHLEGNRWFRGKGDGFNRLRASRQFLLVESIAGRERELRELAEVLYSENSQPKLWDFLS
jgi:Ser/Thr protein kinase RdoA (MazF antagonist)